MGAEGFWFDFVSPQSFLAFRELDGGDHEPALRPISLAALFDARQTSGPPFSPARPEAKARYLAHELSRNAAALGVTLCEPPGHPLDTTLPLSLAVTANDWALTRALFEAYWSGARIDEPAAIARALAAAGLDARAGLAALPSNDALAALTQNLKIAIDAGVFDVPTRIEGGEMTVGFAPRELHRKTSTRAVHFYFDYASPFAYLAATQLPRLVECGVDVTLKPIVLGGLFKALGTANVPLFEMSQAKRDYQLMHLQRSAAAFGVPFRFATRFPMNTVKALRLTSVVAAEQRLALTLAIFAAFWVHDRDIANDDELRSIAHAVGIDVVAIWPALELDETKRALREATDAAMARGVFGVPTIVCGSEPFWGQDQLELVARLF
jgi:2-hydroxychromene-2-carboxylate isomerase